ncbi:hypothetical protein K7X08_007385 [Anisodus acutangulus]|uniref:Uncharacterized protein n=1 Tax=Anisodus acutangulus TaxID=402998 RepID=A0A9Q1QZG1_9SOLA|nr:hypothetical protein K7X08_007385 [Anisodus acutangulus]
MIKTEEMVAGRAGGCSGVPCRSPPYPSDYKIFDHKNSSILDRGDEQEKWKWFRARPKVEFVTTKSEPRATSGVTDQVVDGVANELVRVIGRFIGGPTLFQ